MNTMSGLKDIAILSRLATLRAPGKEVSANLDVIVGELAMLVIVHTKEFGLLRSTKLKTRDEVNDLGNDGGHDKGVRRSTNNGSDLPANDNVVAVHESTCGTSVDAVESDNRTASEESVKNETNDTADTVLSEDIERVINSDEELDCEIRLVSVIKHTLMRWLTLGGKVTGDTSNNAENDTGPGVDETRSRSGSNETRDGTRAPTDHGPLAGQTEIENTPGHGSEHGSEARVPASHNSTEVGAEGRTTVEAKPAKPEEDGTEGDERNVVRAEVHHHLLVTAAENPRVGESGHTRANLDGNTAGIVENAVDETPTTGVPDPVCERAVNESGPEEDENHARNNTASLSNSTDGKSSSDSAEHHLVERV